MRIKIPHITYEVTSICNLTCKYCYNIWKRPCVNSFRHYNSYNQAKKTLKQIFKVADVDHITFTGGEPFMAERFAEIVLYSRMKGKSVTIISNGNAANESQYLQMINMGVNLFELPVHSHSSKVHDYMTEVSGSWENSVNSIKTLVKLKANVVAVIVITKANYRYISETLHFLKELGVNRIMLNRFNLGGKGILEKDNLLISQKALEESYSIASDVGIRYNLKLSSNVCTPLCVLNPDNFPGIRFSICSPDVKRRPLTIDIFGNLRFCNHSPAILGNIFTHDLNTMLSSQKAQLWNNTIPEFCSDCNLYSKCMAGCRAASEQMNISLNSPDPIIELIGYSDSLIKKSRNRQNINYHKKTIS